MQYSTTGYMSLPRRLLHILQTNQLAGKSVQFAN